jgi:GT2 family glycosyltransferase
MDVNAIEVSVVMPCLNEEKTIGACVQKAVEAIKKMGVPGEVVVSDNGSTDRSVEIADVGVRLGLAKLYQSTQQPGLAEEVLKAAIAQAGIGPPG